jgi:Na+/melibiose symporter-like transporter
MTKKKYAKAYDVFARIAKSNKKSTECLKEIEALKVKELTNKTDNDSKEDNTDELESCDELELQKLHNKDTTSDVDEHEASQQQQLAKPLQKSNEKISFLQTIKILFTTRKIVLQFLVTLLNWLTNSLVYYGISYNTSDLSGNPYLNFSLSAFVELLSVIMCQLTLERFGRKRPYCIAMLLSGLSLLCVMFIPASNIMLFIFFEK